MFQFIVTLALLSAVVNAYSPDALADQVVNLPGSEGLSLTFNQFSGYLQIPGNSGNSKNLHYWFVEATQNAATAPLTFWTNGGPGCSGLLGFLTEQGPFRPNADGTLTYNEYAWNTVSNMVFIESPAGVGFSYSDDKADYTNGDAQTALDNYNLIQAFLNRFPDLRSNDLHISSESYGGHYMPTLAKEIVDQNAAGVNPKINFKGFAVGNPYTNVYSGTPAMIDTFWGHQLVSKPLYDQYTSACYGKVKNQAKCMKLTAQISQSVGNLNPYALDYPVCVGDSASARATKFGRAQRIWFFNHLLKAQGFGAAERAAMGLPASEDYQPCEEDYTDAYLNTLAVKQALHVKSSIKWGSCSYKLNYNTTDSEVSTAPIYNYLIDGGFGLNILVYSGDDDSVCGTVGTQDWIWDLGYEISGTEWETYTVDQQTAGFLTKWKNTKLAFLTVHGAGHEVPAYTPKIALDLFTRYLAGEFTNA